MDPVSFAFSALTTAGSCIRLYRELQQRLSTLQTADLELRELVLIVDHYAVKTASQMDILRGMWDLLDPQLQISQNMLLQVLQNRLQVAIVQIDGLIGEANREASRGSLLKKYGDTKRAKYAFQRKSTLQSIVEDIESWGRRFDPSWFLMTRISGIDFERRLNDVADPEQEPNPVGSLLTSLRLIQRTEVNEKDNQTSIFLDESHFLGEKVSISRTGVVICTLPNELGRVILDAQTTFAKPNPRTVDGDVRLLARKLQEVDPLTFGLLRCRGVVRGLNETRMPVFRFVFNIPEGLSQPCSLRVLLLEGSDQRPLDECVRLAKLMARSTAFIHSINFVHKKICPETILVFRDHKSVIGIPFLCGFEEFRLAEGATVRAGDVSWQSNLYRHPERNGISPEKDYIFQHDIYSLGVCLLEIGLWKSFITPSTKTGEDQLNEAIAGLDLSIRGIRTNPHNTKDILVQMAQEKLPSRLGSKYADVVVTCLTCLDENSRFGDEKEFRDKDGIIIGVRYIEKVRRY